MAMDQNAIVNLHQQAGEAAAAGDIHKAIDLCTRACEEARRLWQESGEDDLDAEMFYMLGLKELAMLHYRSNQIAIAERLFDEYNAFRKRLMS